MTLLQAPAQPPYTLVGAGVTQALANNQRNVNVAVVTDSTGVDTIEQATGTDRRWVYLLAQLLGQDFPAYTVQHRQWNFNTNTYDAATTIQVGTGTGNAGGPFVLTMYGAAKTGATSSYWVTEIEATAGAGTVFPVTMDLVMICDGHNEVGHGADVRGTMWNLQRCISIYAPGAPLAWVTQNPQNGAGSGSSAAEQANQLLRQEQVRLLAASEGVGLVEVQPAFLADPNFAVDLLNADGIHPLAAGSVLWAATVKQHFPKQRDTTGRAASAGPISKQDRIWIPASSFSAILGAPTLTSVQNVPAWALAAGVDSILSVTADWPAAWQTINLYVAWVLAASEAAHNWRARVGNQRIAGTFEPATGSGVTLGVALSAGTLSTIAGRNANVVSWDIKSTGTNTLTGFTGRPMMFQVERLGTDGADTIAQAVNIIGMMIQRAS